MKPCHSKSHDHRGWRMTTCWHSSHFFLHWDLLVSWFTTFCHLCCNRISLKWRHDVPANGCWVNHTFASKNKGQPIEWAPLRCFAPIGSGTPPIIFWQAWTSLARKNTLAYFEVLVTKEIKFVNTDTFVPPGILQGFWWCGPDKVSLRCLISGSKPEARVIIGFIQVRLEPKINWLILHVFPWYRTRMEMFATLKYLSWEIWPNVLNQLDEDCAVISSFYS